MTQFAGLMSPLFSTMLNTCLIKSSLQIRFRNESVSLQMKGNIAMTCFNTAPNLQHIYVSALSGCDPREEPEPIHDSVCKDPLRSLS